MRNVFWYQRNQEAVAEALRNGERPDIATTMSSGPLDALVGLHYELGIFDILDEVEVQRQRQGIDDRLLLRTLAVLPFVECPSLTGASEILFGDPAILLHLGWSPLQLRIGDNERHRNPHGRSEKSLPCHPETLRNELGRISEEEWLKVQRRAVGELFQKHLVHGGVYAIDGSGLGDNLRVVSLLNVSVEPPLVVAWRLLEGNASEKGKEASVTRSLIEQAVQLGGEGCIDLLLVDALYADGPLLAWCKYQKQIDVLVPLGKDREIHRDLEQLAAAGALQMQRYSYLRTIQGHKQMRTLDIGMQSKLTGWDSFIAAARSYGDENPCLWACRIEPVNPTSQEDVPWTLCSTRPWITGMAGFEAFRPRWHIENDHFRELKEGWGLEAERWGREIETQRGRVTLTILAYNTAQVYRQLGGAPLADKGIRRLRRQYSPALGRSPVVIYINRNYGVFPVEELLDLLSRPVRTSLRPKLNTDPRPPPAQALSVCDVSQG